MVSYILFYRFGVLFVDQLFDKVVIAALTIFNSFVYDADNFIK